MSDLHVDDLDRVQDCCYTKTSRSIQKRKPTISKNLAASLTQREIVSSFDNLSEPTQANPLPQTLYRIPREVGKPVLLDVPLQIKHIAFAKIDGALHQWGSRFRSLGLAPVIRIISLTHELIRMILEAWPPDPFPKSPLPRRFQPTPK
jgi:hypothetical protein